MKPACLDMVSAPPKARASTGIEEEEEEEDDVPMDEEENEAADPQPTNQVGAGRRFRDVAGLYSADHNHHVNILHSSIVAPTVANMRPPLQQSVVGSPQPPTPKRARKSRALESMTRVLADDNSRGAHRGFMRAGHGAARVWRVGADFWKEGLFRRLGLTITIEVS